MADLCTEEDVLPAAETTAPHRTLTVAWHGRHVKQQSEMAVCLPPRSVAGSMPQVTLESE